MTAPASTPSVLSTPPVPAVLRVDAVPAVDPTIWSTRTRAAMAAAGLEPTMVAAVVRNALTEDLRDGPDVTTLATVGEQARCRAAIAPRTDGVLAGAAVAVAVFETVLAGAAGSGRDGITGPAGTWAKDGTRLRAGDPAFVVRGPTRALLTAERSALNLLGHLSGIATLTQAWVRAVDGTKARIRDTRKTLPGLRALEKYAVRCGGGLNHRMSLGDAALIKDNHVAAAGSVTAAIAAVRACDLDITLEVEVDTLAQLEEALAARADLVLLDNFDLPDTIRAVALRDSRRPAALLESSGGLSLASAAAVAATGVDYLAVGALTHSAPVLDLGMDILAGD